MTELDIAACVCRGGFKLEIKETLNLKGITCVYGQNGAGKSTWMRLIAGLDFYPNVYLKLGETLWQGPDTFVPVQQRNIAMIFQDKNLFPHLTVQQNIDYALKRSSIQPDLSYQKWLYKQLDLQVLLKRSISHLSAGQAQLIALARTLLLRPQLLILDEPFVAIDRDIQAKIMFLLKDFVKKYPTPIFLVTHQQKAIQQLADQIAVLSDGTLSKFLCLGNEGMIDFQSLKLNPFNYIKKSEIKPLLIHQGFKQSLGNTIQATETIRVAADALLLSKQVLESTSLEYQVKAKIEKIIIVPQSKILLYSKVGARYLISLHNKTQFENLNLGLGDYCYLSFDSH